MTSRWSPLDSDLWPRWLSSCLPSQRRWIPRGPTLLDGTGIRGDCQDRWPSRRYVCTLTSPTISHNFPHCLLAVSHHYTTYQLILTFVHLHHHTTLTLTPHTTHTTHSPSLTHTTYPHLPTLPTPHTLIHPHYPHHTPSLTHTTHTTHPYSSTLPTPHTHPHPHYPPHYTLTYSPSLAHTPPTPHTHPHRKLSALQGNS